MAGPLFTSGLAGLLLASGPQPAIATFDDLGKAVAACIRNDDPASGSELELRFVLSARGTIVGKPTVVPVRGKAAMAAERALATTVLEALRRCTPFGLTPAFAQAVAGRPVTLRMTTLGRAVVV